MDAHSGREGTRGAAGLSCTHPASAPLRRLVASWVIPAVLPRRVPSMWRRLHVHHGLLLLLLLLPVLLRRRFAGLHAHERVEPQVLAISSSPSSSWPDTPSAVLIIVIAPVVEHAPDFVLQFAQRHVRKRRCRAAAAAAAAVSLWSAALAAAGQKVDVALYLSDLLATGLRRGLWLRRWWLRLRLRFLLQPASCCC
jgi:hypothetical protein